jgi:3-isopropylmalate dehydrogenase
MSAKKIAVIKGDGIGPEVINESLKILKKVAPGLSFQEFDLGAAQYLRTKEAMPESLFKEVTACDAILLGAVGDPRVPPGILEREVLLRLRFDLDLYINLRPCILYDGVYTPLKHKTEKDIQFVVVRENTESVYAGMGGFFKKGTPDEVAVQEDINTRKGVERAIRYAFELCKARNFRNQLTLVDKANVLTYAHNLWRRTFEEVSKEYPGIRTNAMYVDAVGMDFVRRPELFDTLVTNNIFGDILTDLGAIVSGGLGMAASANLNPGTGTGRYNCRALFEPIHGSAPDIAGKGLANPIAAILAGKMLLDFVGDKAAGERIERAVRKAIQSGKVFKPESADTQMSTSALGDLVASFL